jgi:succinate dehydrogenase / fumarate reductase cytochrome b subunit
MPLQKTVQKFRSGNISAAFAKMGFAVWAGSLHSNLAPTKTNAATRRAKNESNAMRFIIQFYNSSIGKKWIVALTGLALLGFVTGHLLGNLQVYLPPVWINSYARHLENFGAFLWVIRLALLAIIAAHIVTTVKLTMENRAARPDRYAVKTPKASTLASRTMILSGLVILAFIVFHVLHYTVRLNHPQWGVENFALPDGEMVRDVHTMMIEGFKNFGVSAFYIVAVFLLCLHLSHGIASSVQTLGLNSRKIECGLSLAGRAYAWLLFAGYASIPLSVLLGIIHPASK